MVNKLYTSPSFKGNGLVNIYKLVANRWRFYAVGNGRSTNGKIHLAFTHTPLHAQTWTEDEAQAILNDYNSAKSSVALGVLILCMVFPLSLQADPLKKAFSEVNSRYTYAYRLSTPVEEARRPEDGTANCTKYAHEYTLALLRHGVRLSEIEDVTCRTMRGEPHRYIRVGDRVLDNRMVRVVGVGDNNCKDGE